MSRFRWAVVMALVAALVVPPLGLGIQEKEGAKELFDKMEQKLTKARTVEFLIEWKVAAVTVDPSEAKVKLLFAPGNKLRMEMKLKSVGEEVELTLVSDGAKMKRVYRREKPKVNEMEVTDPPRSPDWQKDFLAFLCRAGDGLPFLFRVGGKEVPTRDLAVVSDLKLGKRMKIRDRQAQAVHYQLQFKKGNAKTVPVTVWIDVQTHLPLRRTVEEKQLRLEEDYQVRLDDKFPKGTFDVSQ